MEKHSCKTYLTVRTIDRLDDDKYNEIIDNVESFISNKITNNYNIITLRNRKFIRIGYSESYDVNVNEMLKITLNDLLGKEELILKLQKQFNVETALVIVPEINIKSEEPNPIISLDKFVIEFLYKSNTYEDLDYYII